jgi:hypothetical protein
MPNRKEPELTPAEQ